MLHQDHPVHHCTSNTSGDEQVMMRSNYVAFADCLLPHPSWLLGCFLFCKCGNGTFSSVTIGEQYLLDVVMSLGDSIDVEMEIIHPRYGEFLFDYDIMLLKLAEPSDQPYIKLNLDEDLPNADDRLWVIGFGDTEPLSLFSEQSFTLKEVDLGYVPPKDCDSAYGYDLIREFMMCTTTTDNKAPCQGDSGGPLILKGNRADEDILLGTVSFAEGCADPRFPDVYSRISFFASWIIEQVCELSPDDAPEYMGCNVTTTP